MSYPTHIFDLIAAAEHNHSIVLCPKDKRLLLDSILTLIPAMIDKFVAGAAAHPAPLIDKVTLCDTQNELIDALFYTQALMAKARSTALAAKETML